MNIDKLLDQAKLKAGIKSDLQLSKRIKVTHGAIWQWREKRSLPKPEHVHRLAILAELDPDQLVAQVLIMSTKDEALKKTYDHFLKSVAAILPLLIALPALAQQTVMYIMLNRNSQTKPIQHPLLQ